MYSQTRLLACMGIVYPHKGVLSNQKLLTQTFDYRVGGYIMNNSRKNAAFVHDDYV